MKGGCVNPAFSSQKLSTASVPVRERLPMWREVFGQAMVRLDIEPTKDMPFHAEGTLCALPGAAYASVSASPVRVSRTRRLISADPVEMLYLITADRSEEHTSELQSLTRISYAVFCLKK